MAGRIEGRPAVWQERRDVPEDQEKENFLARWTVADHLPAPF